MYVEKSAAGGRELDGKSLIKVGANFVFGTYEPS
jgi:hypothetical protein